MRVLEDVGWAVASLLMLLVAELICEFVILSWAKNSRELMVHDNRAVACIEGGVYIGSGFIIAAVTQAETLPLSCLFFVLGETAIVVFSSVYQWATEWNDRAAVESKNIAAGAHWGISLIAIGLLLSRALYLSQSLYTFALWFFLGSPVLLASPCEMLSETLIAYLAVYTMQFDVTSQKLTFYTREDSDGL